MLEVKWKGLQEIKRELETLQRKAIPYAAKEALNNAAKATLALWDEEIQKSFTLRNQFTRRSLRLERARGTNVRDMRATVGTISPYLPKQEAGIRIAGHGKSKAVPTAVAAGQRLGGARTRPVKAFGSIKLIPPTQLLQSYGNRRFNAASMAIARRKGFKFALLRRRQGGLGIFKVGMGRTRFNPRLAWNLAHRAITLKPRPILAIALARVRPNLPDILREAFISQCRFHHIAGY